MWPWWIYLLCILFSCMRGDSCCRWFRSVWLCPLLEASGQSSVTICFCWFRGIFLVWGWGCGELNFFLCMFFVPWSVILWRYPSNRGYNVTFWCIQCVLPTLKQKSNCSEQTDHFQDKRQIAWCLYWKLWRVTQSFHHTPSRGWASQSSLARERARETDGSLWKGQYSWWPFHCFSFELHTISFLASWI